MITRIFINNFWVDFDKKRLESTLIGKRNFFKYDSKKIKSRCKIEFICTKCGNNSNFVNFNLKDIENFANICGACSRKIFNKKHYGVENPSQREDIKEKKKQTQLKNYGTTNGFEINSVKETMKERYGVEHASQSREILEKSQQTILLNNDGLHTFQTDEFKNKSKQTKIDKYGDENYTNREQAKETLIKNYGVDNPTKSPLIIKNIIRNNNIRYGVDWPIQLDEIQEKSQQSKLELYGDEFYSNIEKAEQTNMEKYGFKNPAKSEKVKEKTRQTNIEKFGVDYPLQSDEVKKRVANTNKVRYGKENVTHNPSIKQRVKETHLRKFYKTLVDNKSINKYVQPIFDESEYIKKESKYDKFLWLCKKCNKEFEDYIANGRIPLCTHCYPRKQSSSLLEKEVIEYIRSLSVNNIVENSKKIIQPYELDIYLPDYNLAIEFNGLYWHSELNGKDKNYHLNKTNMCKEKNIQLLHIFEDEWLNKQEIIKNIISIKLGLVSKIYGRKCVAKELQSKDCKEFLEQNHIQGYIPAKVNIGLYYEDELVSLLTFGKSRFNKSYEWEILRYINKAGISIIGGFSKLLKYFLTHYSGSIITYSDARLFDGGVYRKNGFKELSMSPPAYFYTKGIDRFNRQQFQKHKLKDKLETFEPNLTEWQNMQLNGYDRIWDCGNYVFELRR